ncbi:sensor histidine kinase [Streptomyces nodosus]|nr:histidine kinase [Streptomyces nodosus]MBB4796125.1 signal transduction histidine kinase [Streptomyces nodosus]
MMRILGRRPFVLDAMAALGFALLPQLAPVRTALAGGGSGEAAGWLLSLAAALPLAVRRVWPLPVFAFVLTVACVAVPFGLAATSFPAAAYALYAVAVSRRRPGRGAVAVGGGCAVGAALLTMTGGQHYEGGTGTVQVVFGVLALGATWAAGAAVREQRENVLRVIEQTAERAKVEERLRIARDMHDVVTHSVGLIAVKAGIANHVVDTRPQEAREALTVIEGVSRKALRDLRSTLQLLRQDEAGADGLKPLPGLADLPALVRTAEAAGVHVDLASRCAEQLPDAVVTSAYRIVQEALTNVVKHAAPTRCRVELAAREGALTIEVADDGPVPGGAHRPVVPGGGLGLVGMRERAEAHGGALSAGPRPGGGFRVLATLPY